MATAPAPRPRSRAVMWVGLMLGTALAVLAMMDGARLKIGGVPPFLGWILGGAIVWLMVVFATTGIAELLRRHHRPIRRAAARQAGRGLGWGWRGVRRHGGRGLSAAGGWLDGRWTTRQSAPQAPGRDPVDLGSLLRPSRWLPGRRPAGGTGVPTDPNPTPPDGLPPVPPATADGTAGGAWGDPDPAADYGPGPWVLGVRHRDGQPYYGGPGGPQVGTALVRTPDDLRQRLETAATDPGTEVRVAPAKVTDPGLVPAALDPALEQDIRRQVCERYAADGIEPGEVIVHADGAVTIDRRRNSQGRYSWAKPLTGTVRWAPQPDGSARVTSLYPPPTDSAGGTPPPAAGNTDQQHGGNDMTTATDTTYPAPQYPGSQFPAAPRRAARTAVAPEPNGVWRPLISSTHGFEPENDGHLLGWMAGEAGGMSGYAEEIADVYETAVNTIGLDPVAMAALHDYADAAATAAEAMAKARQRFADHYSEVRQFTANGGVLPYNGRWMTGEGD